MAVVNCQLSTVNCHLAHYLEFRKLQTQFFLPDIPEVDDRAGTIPLTFHREDFPFAELLVKHADARPDDHRAFIIHDVMSGRSRGRNRRRTQIPAIGVRIAPDGFLRVVSGVATFLPGERASGLGIHDVLDGDLIQKTTSDRRRLHTETVPIVRVAEEQHLLRPGDPDIEQPPLLLDVLRG